MQPVSQISLDPRSYYIRHLRADQLFHWVMGYFIEIPSKVEEKYLASLQADHRNTPHFPASITTLNPR
jgi:hypothetical protein